jgi:ribose transport system permease protein
MEVGGARPADVTASAIFKRLVARWREALSRYPNLRAVITVWLVFLAVFALGAALGWVTHLSQVETALVLAVFALVVAFGQNVVILAGGIDLSVPLTITSAGIFMTELASSSGSYGILGILGALAFATAIGVWNGVWVAYLKVSPLIATLGTNIILTGVVLAYSQGKPIGSAPQPLINFMTGSIGPFSNVLVIGLIFTVVATLLLLRTTFGRRIYAIGNSPDVSYLSGIPTRAVTISVYALASFSYGLAGVMLSGWNRQASPLMGDPFLFPSIAAVVLGGTSILGGRGNVVGTAGGAALFTAIGTILAATTLPPSTRDIVIGVVLILAVVMIQRERVNG